MNIMEKLTPEQRQALASMPEQLAMRILANMDGGQAAGQVDPYDAPYNPAGAQSFLPPQPPAQAAPTPAMPSEGFVPQMTNAAPHDAYYAPSFDGIPQLPTPNRKAGPFPANSSDHRLFEGPGDAYNPDLMEDVGGDPRGMFFQEDAQSHLGTPPQMPGQTSFVEGAEYKTADMSNIPPSGTGAAARAHDAARAYQTLMKSIDDYEKIFAEGGSTMWPGARRDTLSTAHRDLQMQMKELYNLGVLNGPDLMLMNQILIDPTTVGGNVMDSLGIADMEQRIPANINHVKRMMTNLVEPTLQQIGLRPTDLQPKTDPSQMSDEELLKALGGGS